MKKTFMLAIFSMLTACASMGPKAPYSLALTEKQSVTIKILNKDINGNSITRSIVENAVLKKGMSADESKSPHFDSNGQVDYYNWKGTKALINNDNIAWTYFNGIVVANGDKVVTTSTANFPFSIIEENNYWIVSVAMPTEIKVAPQGILGGMDPFFATDSMYQQDIQYRLNNIKDVVINAIAKIEGEINSQYDEKSIYANFERGFGSHHDCHAKDEKSIIKEVCYDLDGGRPSQSRYLKVSISPYRSGSKIIYYAYLSYTIGEKMSLSTDDLKSIKGRIEKVVTE